MAKPRTPPARISRLGRGLSSLIHNSSPSAGDDDTYMPVPAGETDAGVNADSAQLGTRVAQIPIRQIGPNPYQPRRDFDEAELAELAASIKRQGVLQPLIVSPAVSEDPPLPYVLIAGQRRLKAAAQAGLEAVPCTVRRASAEQMLEWALVENIQRVDLNPIERARAYQEYIDRFGLTRPELAQRIAEPRTTLTNYLRLLELSPEVQQLLAEGALTFGHGKVLAGLAVDPETQLATARRAARGRLSVRQLEALVAAAKGDGANQRREPGAGPAYSARPAYIGDLEERLCESVGTRVRILPGRKKHSGRIVVEYYSLDEFDRIGAMLGLHDD